MFKLPTVFFDADSGGGSAGADANANSDTTDYKALYDAAVAKSTLEVAELQKRFGGLQTTFQKEQAAKTAAIAELATLKSQHEQTSAGFEALTAEKKTLAEQLVQKEAALTEKEMALQRKSVIMDKYPELAAFEAKNLLPQSPIDKLEETLKLFAESLKTVSERAKQDHAAGGVGGEPPKKSDTARTAPVVLKEAQEAARKGNQESYQLLYKEYLALLDKK